MYGAPAPSCRFKPRPPQPANSSCSIFIKPSSLKEPRPERGESHSPRALSTSALIPAAACAPLSLSLSPSRPPPTPSSTPPSLSLSLSLAYTHFHLHTLGRALSLARSHTFLHKHTHAHAHTRVSPTYLCRLVGAERGERCWRRRVCGGWGGGFSAAVSLRVLCHHLGEEAALNCFALSSSSHSWNAKTGLMDISELCLPDPLSYHNQ